MRHICGWDHLSSLARIDNPHHSKRNIFIEVTLVWGFKLQRSANIASDSVARDII